MTAVQIIATTMLAALFLAVLSCAAWVRRKNRAEKAFWQRQDDIAIAEDLARLRSKLEPISNTYGHTRTPAELALDTIREQASAAARHDICQPLGVPLTPNPHAAHTVQHKAWEAIYHHSMRIAIQLERSKS